MLDEAELGGEDDAGEAREVLESGEGAGVGELGDGPFVDDGEEGGGDAVAGGDAVDGGLAEEEGAPSLVLWICCDWIRVFFVVRRHIELKSNRGRRD